MNTVLGVNLDPVNQIPLNPFKELRQTAKLTLDELSQKMYASRQALIRLEQGTYFDPLPVAIEYWVRNGSSIRALADRRISELVLRDEYTDYQEKQRARHFHYFGDGLFIYTNHQLHPFGQLKLDPVNNREKSTSEVCKAICFPQATLQHWEKKWRIQQTVPSKFQMILGEIGYNNTQIRDFCRSYIEWRNYRLGRAV